MFTIFAARARHAPVLIGNIEVHIIDSGHRAALIHIVYLSQFLFCVDFAQLLACKNLTLILSHEILTSIQWLLSWLLPSQELTQVI